MPADEIDLRDEDRLPWLETIEPDAPERSNLLRIVAAVLLGLAVLAAVVFAATKLQQRSAPAGGGDLIAAQEGDYKIKPDEPGGLKVEGEGDSAIATSAGAGSGNAAIDLKAVPEAPVTGKRAPLGGKAGAPGGSKAVADVPASGGRLSATPPMAVRHTAVPGAASGGSLVQLGAFPSEAAANAAWSAVAKRFGYVATLGKSIQPAQVGGRSLYRLRVNAGSADAAADICGRLKVAGEGCFVTS